MALLAVRGRGRVVVGISRADLRTVFFFLDAGAGSDHDGTRNMSRAVHLLYLFR
jgi:hypothetical protein